VRQQSLGGNPKMDKGMDAIELTFIVLVHLAVLAAIVKTVRYSRERKRSRDFYRYERLSPIQKVEVEFAKQIAAVEKKGASLNK
jgi:hypothetical protein